MKTLNVSLLMMVALLAAPSEASPLGTAFTYQGRLTDSSSPATGNYDLQFILRDAANGGNQVGATLTNSPVAVENGVFTVTLDFGVGIFTGAASWLEIGVRTYGSPSAYTTLAGRQPLTPTPYAIYAGQSSTVNNAAITPSQLQTTAAPIGGQVLGFNGTLLEWQTPVSASALWGLSGNGGTTGANFLGTTDAQPLDLRANNSRVLRLEQVSRGSLLNNINSVNVAGGFSINSVTTGVVGGTIGGGGYTTRSTVFVDHPNRVDADFGTVGGGADNLAGEQGSTVSGGFKNTASGQAGVGGFATVSGGSNNLASGFGCTVSGGLHNTASGRSSMSFVSAPATVGGGQNNTASGEFSTVPGGSRNTASGEGSFAAGRFATASHDGSFVWGDGTQAANSTGANTFSVLAQGGIGFYVNNASVNIASDGTLSCKVLTITGGADVAEPFKMASANIPPGAVVVIDDENPGSLKMSDHAYDSHVAGIISGANGIKPGIALHQEGALEGGQNVALSGRVYVLADASTSPIKPGDLLTTSSIPGHAMKVTDYAKAQGAILGKAMSALSDPKGIVLALVTLQ